MRILWGHDRHTGKPIYFPWRLAERHLHLVGYTGSGKTTAILTFLVGLFCNPALLGDRSRGLSVFAIDRLGGFSKDVVRWFASPYCPQWVRDRLIYIECAREDITVGMNPLLYKTPGEGYYRTARAAEIILRGSENQDLSTMPRLAKWLFNSTWAAAQLKLTIADTLHLLFPYSQLHGKILNCLPEGLRYEWQQIINAPGGQAEILLDSTRSRLKPIYESNVLRPTFSSEINRLDVTRWMREGKIVLINLAPMGRLPETSADMIGSMVVNEIFSVARSLAPEERGETLLVLDEFQRFLGPDMEFALAESRQLGIRMLLSHQSFSQLETASTDLTSLIFQCQTRLAFKVAAMDAEILAAELASLTFDPMRVKHEIWHRHQRISGHKLIELHSRQQSEALAEQWNETWGTDKKTGRTSNWNRGRLEDQYTTSSGDGTKHGRGKGGSTSNTHGHSTSQALMAEYEEYMQLASKTFLSFDEQKLEWGKKLRQQIPGQGVLDLPGIGLHEILIKRTNVGELALPWKEILASMPRVRDAYDRLLEENFRQDCFVSPAVIEKETELRLQRVLQPRIELIDHGDTPAEESPLA